MRRSIVLIVIVVLLLALPSASGAASPGAAVDFEVLLENGGGPFPRSGTFEAWGPAVDDGTLCGAGDTIEEFSYVKRRNLRIHKRFSCADGSGEFLVKINAKGDYDVNYDGRWRVVSGTGPYEKLHGSGNMWFSAGQSYEVYGGKVK